MSRSDPAVVGDARLRHFMHRFSKAKVWVVGDIMLDEYLHGDVSRISPDAPVQVVQVQDHEFRLGGAANVARGIAALGAAVELLGIVGNDDAGRTVCDLCEQAGVGISALGVQDRLPTIRKTRVVARQQHVVRLDREVVSPLDVERLQALFDRLDASSARPDILVLSDYAKGVLPRLWVSELCAWGSTNHVPVFVDPKVLDLNHYAGASLIKPNRREVEAMLGSSFQDSEAWCNDTVRPALEQARIEAMLVTLGEEGMMLIPRHGDMLRIRSASREVFDVTGAGDTALAAFAVAAASGQSWEEAARVSNAAAGLAVSKVGTAMVENFELAEALMPRTRLGVVSRDTLLEYVAWWRLQERSIVFTNGCFDLLHRGHVELLRVAAASGDVLIVGVNDDASVERLKGADRPVHRVEDRMELLAALDCVDAVVRFGEDTPADLIDQLLPDVLIKGGDYRAEDVVGAETVIARGGRVEIVEQIPGHSTSALLERVRAPKED